MAVTAAAPAAGLLAPPLPPELQLEVTGACNLRCRMCLVSYRPALGKTTGSMDLETFKRIVDDLPDLERVTMQGLGEPLLAPDFFPMLEHLAARGIATGFNTNGTLLTRERRSAWSSSGSTGSTSRSTAPPPRRTRTSAPARASSACAGTSPTSSPSCASGAP